MTDKKPKQQTFNDLKAEQGRQDKAKARAAKHVAFEFEKKNNSKIYVFYSGKGWWKMGGASALIYNYVVRVAAGLEPILRDDGDFNDKFITGITSIAKIGDLETLLESQGIKLEEKGDDYYIFDLGKKYSRSEIKTFSDVRDEQKKEINRIVKTTEYVYPEIVEKQRRIVTTFYHLLNHLNKKDQGLIIDTLLSESMKTLVDLEMLALDEEMKPQLVLKRAWNVNERTKFYLMALMDIGVVDAKKVFRLESELVDVNKLIGARLKQTAVTAQEEAKSAS